MTIEGLPQAINGWFAVAFSHEVPRESVRVARYMGKRLAIFRTAAGKVAVVDANCPHLGAAFEHNGRVVGEELRCASHDFRFDRQGACTSAYGSPAANVRLRSWHAVERGGAIFVWFHGDDAPPSWQLPAWDEEGWSRPRRGFFRAPGHPQDVGENGVDAGHLIGVHGFHDVQPESLKLEGPHLTARMDFTTRARVIGSIADVRVTFRYDSYGLGLGVADATAAAYDLRIRTYLAPTLSDDGTMHLRSWTSMDRPERITARIPLLGRVLPTRLVRAALGTIAHYAFVTDIQKDMRYWRTKRYVAPPALGRLDVNIGPYRKWARQFYPEPARAHVSLPMLAP